MIRSIPGLAIIICLSGFSHELFAQTGAQEDALLQEIGASAAIDITQNTVTMQQTGDANQAYVRQLNVSTANLVEIYQSGYTNTVDLLQQGSNFGISLSQEGNGNEYVGEIDGVNARMEISQYGEFNSIHQAFKITDASLTIIQEGEGHQLIQTRDVRNAQGMRITQRGNGATIIIR